MSITNLIPGGTLAQEATRRALEQEARANQARIRRHYSTIGYILWNRARGMSEKRLVEIWGKDIVALALEIGKPKAVEIDPEQAKLEKLLHSKTLPVPSRLPGQHPAINGPVVVPTSLERKRAA